MTFTRKLGRSGIEVSALGMGCWAIGGPIWEKGTPHGWGEVDDNESISAIHRAMELGVNFFDTANLYGAGHSEKVLGRSFAGRRKDVVIATKFNTVFDEQARELLGSDTTPAGIEPDHMRLSMTWQSCVAVPALEVAYLDVTRIQELRGAP